MTTPLPHLLSIHLVNRPEGEQRKSWSLFAIYGLSAALRFLQPEESGDGSDEAPRATEVSLEVSLWLLFS